MAKMQKHVVTVTLDDEMGGTVEMTVQTDNRDMLAWERTCKKNGWPKADDGGSFTWMTFLAWSALYRAGDTKNSMSRFMEDLCLDVTMEHEDVDPTDQETATGS